MIAFAVGAVIIVAIVYLAYRYGIARGKQTALKDADIIFTAELNRRRAHQKHHARAYDGQ